MNDYVILTDSASDLPSEIIKELNINVLPMKYIVDDKIYAEGQHSSKEFYSLLRKKSLLSTTQINAEEFLEYFSEFLENGKDILYIGFSLSLSGMYNSASMAGKKLCEKFSNRKIKVLDSVCASIGQGLLVYYAALKKNQGFSIDEVELWVNKNKLKFCHWFTVDDLYYLKKGGRISSTVAMLGNILIIKPILSMNDDVFFYLSEKIRGRQKTLDAMISKLKNNLHPENKLIFIGHADCIDEAEYVSNKIKQEFSLETKITDIGSIIGTHTGPGTVAVTFMGNSR